mgnify:CR=1 FL=1
MRIKYEAIDIFSGCGGVSCGLSLSGFKIKSAVEIEKRAVNTYLNYKPLEKVNIKDLKENETVEEVFECPTCGNHEKVLYCSGVSKIFCAYCGVDI